MKYSKCCRIIEPNVWSSEHLFLRILSTSPKIENPVNPAATPRYKVNLLAGILGQTSLITTPLHNLLDGNSACKEGSKRLGSAEAKQRVPLGSRGTGYSLIWAMKKYERPRRIGFFNRFGHK